MQYLFLAFLLAAPILPAQEAAYFQVSVTGGDIVIRLTDPEKIERARDIVAGRETSAVSVTGILVKAPALYNRGWSYHYDPQSIDFFSFAIEVCDASATYVEENLEDVGGALLPGQRWCPWSSRVTAELPPPNGAEDLLQVTSAASFSEVAVAPGSLGAIFGIDLAEETASATGVNWPFTLGGVTLEWRRPNEANYEPLRLQYVSARQINFMLPEDIATGVVAFRVSNTSGRRVEGFGRVENVAPGIFAIRSEGRTYAAAGLVRVRADGSQSYEPLVRVDSTTGGVVPVAVQFGPESEQLYLVLYGTGIRRADSQDVEVTLDGNFLRATYAGAQGSLPGVDQINVPLQRELAGRESVDVRLTAPLGANRDLLANVVRLMVQ